MRVRRAVVVLSACLCAVLALAGCQTKVGAAAFVGSHRISQSDVDDQVLKLRPDDAAAAADTMQVDPAQRIAAVRNFVLTYQIRSQVFAEALRRNGGLPGEDEIAAAHDAALTLVFGAEGESDETVRSALANIGVNPDFVTEFNRSWQLESILLDRLRLSGDEQLPGALAAADFDVKVNARYGSWDQSSLGLVPGSTPSFLRLSSATSAG